MSAFDDWHANKAKWGGTRMMGRDLAKRAWNAALDQLDGLADRWADPEQIETVFVEDCAAQLKARIKEIRT